MHGRLERGPRRTLPKTGPSKTGKDVCNSTRFSGFNSAKCCQDRVNEQQSCPEEQVLKMKKLLMATVACGFVLSAMTFAAAQGKAMDDAKNAQKDPNAVRSPNKTPR